LRLRFKKRDFGVCVDCSVVLMCINYRVLIVLLRSVSSVLDLRILTCLSSADGWNAGHDDR
jgi:hypothetical protein